MTAAYNALGQRMVKASGSEVRVYAVDEAGRPLGVYVLDSTATAGFRTEDEYVHLDGWRPVAVVRPDATTGMANPQIFPILTDHLGTPRKVLDGATGQVRRSWDAKQLFGHEMPNETPTAGQAAFTFDLRFPGQRYDEETGLFHNGFRDYHSGLGRYVQSDPLGLEAGWNTFAYTGSSPLNRKDPKGLDWFRDWDDTETTYVVGREGNPLVSPGSPVSKFFEHCVPAGRTFGQIHDQRVDTLKKGGVPDWKANIPTMPGAYMDAVTQEDNRMWSKVERWWWNLFEFDKPWSEKP
jgi:hypothetical protein